MHCYFAYQGHYNKVNIPTNFSIVVSIDDINDKNRLNDIGKLTRNDFRLEINEKMTRKINDDEENYEIRGKLTRNEFRLDHVNVISFSCNVYLTNDITYAVVLMIIMIKLDWILIGTLTRKIRTNGFRLDRVNISFLTSCSHDVNRTYIITYGFWIYSFILVFRLLTRTRPKADINNLLPSLTKYKCGKNYLWTSLFYF